MKVLYVSKALVVQSYRSKIRCLAQHVDVRAIVPDAWPPLGVEPVDGDAAWLARRPVWFAGHPHVYVYRRIGALLDQFRPDLVHIDEEPYNAVTTFALRACVRRRIPAVFFAAQNIYKRLPPPFGALRRYVLRHAHAAQAGTAAAAHVLRDAGYRGPIATFPQLGVDETQFRPDPTARARTRASWGVTDDRVVVGFGGRLVRYKAVHLLLDAIARVPAVMLVISGDGAERASLERRAAALGVLDRVRFGGHRLSATMPAWLAGLDLLALPSIATRSIVEQFGRILIEAMACGIPVIGSNSGGIPDVIAQAGLVVPEGDVPALAGAIERLAASRTERAALAEAGRSRVLATFTQRRIADDTRAWYAEILT